MLGSQIPTATAALRFPFLAADISLDIPIFRALTKHKSSNTLPFFWRRGQRARTSRRGSLWGRHVSRSYCGVSQHHSCSQKPGISAHRSQTTPKNPRSMYHSNPWHGQSRCWKHYTMLESESSRVSWLTQGRKKVSFAQTCFCTQSWNSKPAQIGHVSVVIVDGLHQPATSMLTTSTRMEASLHQHNTSEERRPEINSAAGEAQRSSCSH